MSIQPTTLVIGANGKTGGRVAARLTQAGWPVRRGSRSGSPAFDWEIESTWSKALSGVEQVYITFQPDLAVPGAVATIQRFTAAAVSLGINKLVLLSGRGEDAAQACEAIVQRSGVSWTVVRTSWFCQNFDEGHFLDSVRSGILALPAGNAVEAFVDADDIADVVVAALTDDRHASQRYELTGPRLMSFEEVARDLAEAAGFPIRYIDLPSAQFQEALVSAGVPQPFAAFLTELMGLTLDGRNAHLTDGVERALGRPARDFTEYARDAARTGVWSPS